MKKLEEDLSSIDHVQYLLKRRSDSYGSFNGDKTPCTLVIDAFTTTAITPYSKRRYVDGNKSNCFLFLIQPINKNLKIFLNESESGMVDEKTFDLMVIRIIKAALLKAVFSIFAIRNCRVLNFCNFE